jgi:fatty-acid desaturase
MIDVPGPTFKGKHGLMSQVASPRDGIKTNVSDRLTGLDRQANPQTAADRPRVAELPEKRRHQHDAPIHHLDKQVSDPATRPTRGESRPYINWPVVFWIGVLHIGALAAPFFFSWQAVVLVFALHWLTGGIGICLGFHRMITHTSFQTYRPIRWLIALIGGLAGEGSVLDWVANHRKHHAHSDQPEDPHSPHDGGFWSHMLWLFYMSSGEAHKKHIERWSPDLLKDPGMRWIGAMFLPTNVVLGLSLMAIGYGIGGWYMAMSFLTWGMFVRMCFVLHSTWFVNSASHMWGYRNYVTTDDSRNNWWVALVSYGEGWHNNHHAYPRMAPHGHRWWEVDVTFATIRLMQFCGLAWDVVDYKRGGKGE